METLEPLKLLTLAELRKKHRSVRDILTEKTKKPTTLDKIALWITNKVGTMGFFLIIFTWTVIWLSWNMFAPVALRFDPFPAFVLWLFISNMIQIFLMPLIMVGQNIQGRHSEARSKADFEVNTKAEEEIETILLHLQNQNDLIIKILNKLDIAGN